MGLQIGITGGIGAGKTIVCQVFELLGVPVYDADTMAKKLMVEDSEIVSAVQANFGKESYSENGELNRQHIAQQVFGDSDKVKLLNSIVHPRVGKHYADWVKLELRTNPYVIKEAALMFESGSYKVLDKVINVSASEEVRIGRVLRRDSQRNHEQVKGIISKQLSEDERLKKADIILYNDEKELLIPKVIELDKQFRALANA